MLILGYFDRGKQAGGFYFYISQLQQLDIYGVDREKSDNWQFFGFWFTILGTSRASLGMVSRLAR
jgi:hypothetical protein